MILAMWHYARPALGIVVWGSALVFAGLSREYVGAGVAAVLLAMPAIDHLILAAERRAAALEQAKKGKCAVCGYDLRATPDHCPECGTIPSKMEIISN